jgi:methionyl-tRNA synthetase
VEEQDVDERERPQEEGSRPAAAKTGLVDIARFAEIDLRVAEILRAERVEGADKLLRLEITLGGETRQIVAGIARSYLPESLVGKRIIVVANLEPARIRGVESQGMLLAADSGAGPVVAPFETEVAPGTRVR